jgi:hypothetical protein
VLGAAAFVLATVALWGPRAEPAHAALQVVTLTSTLNVNSNESYRDIQYVWNGPSTAPVIKLYGAQFATLDHIQITVPTGYHATAGIELANNPTFGGPLGNDLKDIKIGTFNVPANVDYGILWSGTVNGEANSITNAKIYGAGTAAVFLDDPQATGNTFRGLSTSDTPIGIKTRAGGSNVTCDNCMFLHSTDVDVELLEGSGLFLLGPYSQLSRRFARVNDGGGGGGLSVTGGMWAWNASYASGPTIEGLNPCCRLWVRLTDFMVTPLDGTNHGTFSGFTAAQKFLSNTAGIV